MAAPAYRASANAGAATAANITLALSGANCVDGDILLVVISKDATGAITPPSGGSNCTWTLIKSGTADSFMLAYYWARWNTGNATSHVFSFASTWRDCTILSFSGGRAGDVLDPAVTATIVESASANSITTNGITTVTNDVRVIGIWNNFEGSGFSADANTPAMTNRVTYGELRVADYALVTAGATGGKIAGHGTTNKMKGGLLGFASVAAGGSIVPVLLSQYRQSAR